MPGQMRYPTLERMVIGWAVGGQSFVCGGVTRHNAVHAANVDNRTRGLTLAQVARHIAGEQEISGNANVIRLIEVLRGCRINVRRRTPVGVVDQYINLLHLLNNLSNKVGDGIRVVAYDPAAMEDARQALGKSVGFTESAEDCIQQSNLVVITTPWKEFETLEPGSFGPSGSRVLIDCWRVLEASGTAAVTDYIPMGVGPEPGS